MKGVYGLWIGLLAVACKGGEEGSAPVPEAPLGVGESGARRLSHAEFDAVLRDLLLDDTEPADAFLPLDVIDPFDNDLSTQEPSAVLVQGLEAMANDVAARFAADAERRAAVVGCEPAGPTDRACLESFVRRFGRLALRRPVLEDEVTALIDVALPFAEASGSFWDAVDVVVRVLLQAPSFVYRVELGTPTDEPGVFALNGYEVATRMSFLLWGSTPDDALLDLAAAGALDTPAGRREAAVAMLDDPRARDRIDRFHAMWLGYWSLPHAPELTEAMRTETRALVEDVVFERRASWLELFTADGTFVNDFLADHYGLPRPGTDAFTWVAYGDSGRKGLLSHGSFLSVNAKFGDTSPTLRGKLVRERLLCQTIPPPPPDVNVDEPPGGDDPAECKIDRYEQHRSDGACKACHELVDPIGFGLEAYDREGVFRTHDEGNPDCPIDGQGALDGETFEGPAGLADLLVAGPTLPACAVEQTYRFAMGHAPGDHDQPLVDRLTVSLVQDGFRLDELLLDLVGDPAFGFRRDEGVQP